MSSLSKQQEWDGDEPELSETELDSYIISLPDLTKSKKRATASKSPATPIKGDKKSKKLVDATTPSTKDNPSPSKSDPGIYTSEEEDIPAKKAYGCYGTDARAIISPLKGSRKA